MHSARRVGYQADNDSSSNTGPYDSQSGMTHPRVQGMYRSSDNTPYNPRTALGHTPSTNSYGNTPYSTTATTSSTRGTTYQPRPRADGYTSTNVQQQQQQQQQSTTDSRHKVIVTSASYREPSTTETPQASSTPTTNSVVPKSAGPAQMQHNPQLITQTRCLRRLYVGNLPPNVLTEAIIKRYFVLFTKALGFTTPDPVIDVSLTTNSIAKNYCFVEFRSVWDTDAVLHLMQGAMMGTHTLKLNRPKDYHGCPEDLRYYIVNHPPGSYTPPHYVSSTEWTRTDTQSETQQQLITSLNQQYQYEQQKKAGIDPASISTEPSAPEKRTFATTDDELRYVDSLSPQTISAFLQKFSALLTPLTIPSHELLTPNQPPAEPTRVVRIKKMVTTPEKLVLDNDWLNLCDDLYSFIIKEVLPVFAEDPVIVKDIIIPRPNPPFAMGAGSEIDTSSVYLPKTTRLAELAKRQEELMDDATHTNTSLAAQAEVNLPTAFEIRAVGPWHDPVAVRDCFVVCDQVWHAHSLHYALNRSLYYKHKLIVEYCDESITNALLSHTKQ